METAMQNIFHHLQTLRRFQEKYDVPEGVVAVGPVSVFESETPSVMVDGRVHRQWIIETFGPNDWQTEYLADGWQHVRRVIDGVSVAFMFAYEIPAITAVPKDVPPHLLTGREAGIELPDGSVREVEVAP